MLVHGDDGILTPGPTFPWGPASPGRPVRPYNMQERVKKERIQSLSVYTKCKAND